MTDILLTRIMLGLFIFAMLVAGVGFYLLVETL